MFAKLFGKASRAAGGRGGLGARIIHSRVVLYALFLLATANAYAFLWRRDFASLALLVLAGLVASAFTKNMVVVLSAALVAANLVDRAARASFNEGFEAPADAPTEDADKDKDKDDDKDKDGKADGGAGEKPAGPDASGGASPEKMDEMKKQYMELMALQKQIVDGVKGVYEPLQKAEVIVSGMRGSMKTP